MPVSPQDLLAAAPYIADLAERHADWFAGAREQAPGTVLAEALEEIRTAGQGAHSEAEIGARLRVLKGRMALLAAASETSGRWSTREATAALSDVADASLDAALDVLMRLAGGKGEVLGKASAAESGLVLFALGKQGGRELNYSSDIDIVAFFEPRPDYLAEPDEASKFYVRVVRHLAAILQDRTEHGYVFRTDLRLRPDPGSTPVAMPVEAALTYYEARGQNWERAAWIKARIAAGDRAVGEAFLKDLAPFIWRRHLDFATISDIQAMKRQINIVRKVGAPRLGGHNVKLGRGGIREIEFFAQTQQLIAGGRDPALRVRPTVAALEALAASGWITPDAARELSDAYWFLRAVENRLQMINDEQTHTLPEDDAALGVISDLMDMPDVAAFEARYRAALATVETYYGELFTEGAPLAGDMGNLVFTGSDDDPGTLDTLQQLGFADAANASRLIRKWHYGSYAATRTAAARAHLTELMPALLKAFSAAKNADGALARFDNFLSRLPAGVQLFALLRTHEQVLRLLVAFMASAPRMAEAVIGRAHVLDGLIDPAFASDVTDREVLVAKVGDFLADARGYEDLIDRARIIGHEQLFLISAGLLSGAISAAVAGRQLTALAETLLDRLFAAVREEFAVRHGVVPGATAALLAFGKMGSREMTATSDLDFILLYDAPEGVEASDGKKPLEVPVYFARLTQRLIAALSAPTAEGVLYEADMRLRPSGNAGPLATSLGGFERYQKERAWTWEHLALTRARSVAGDDATRARIEAVVAEALDADRDPAKIVDDTLEMLERLARDRKPRHPFDLKLVRGGLMDLEFVAQSGRLLLGSDISAEGTGIAAMLRAMGQANALPEAERLAEIHDTYSAVVQTMSACLIDPFREDAWTDAFRELLARMANYPDFSRLETEISAMQEEVKAAAADWYQRARSL